MACLVSLPWSFSTRPLRKPLTQEISTYKVDNRKLPSPVGSITGAVTLIIKGVDNRKCPSPVGSITVTEVISPKYWGRRVFATRSYHHHVTTQSRINCELVSSHYNVSCSLNPIVISGFWVGPDNEDGWGFVEAVVTQIF